MKIGQRLMHKETAKWWTVTWIEASPCGLMRLTANEKAAWQKNAAVLTIGKVALFCEFHRPDGDEVASVGNCPQNR